MMTSIVRYSGFLLVGRVIITFLKTFLMTSNIQKAELLMNGLCQSSIMALIGAGYQSLGSRCRDL